jgi:hypothetical protein
MERLSFNGVTLPISYIWKLKFEGLHADIRCLVTFVVILRHDSDCAAGSTNSV